MFDFQNRTLLLTGANGGIGREVARAFYNDGANLVLADMHIAPMEEFVASLGADSSRVLVQAIDVSKPKDNDAIVKSAVDKFGGLDFVVPSAGIYPAEPFKEMTDEQWHRLMSINLDGVFYILRRCVAHLRENSAIVNLSSVAAYRGAQTNAHYSAAKGALISLTRSLAKELGPKTRVNAVAPGIIKTPMISDLLKTRSDESISSAALKRLGEPEEIASVIAFLCSDAASFITGETVHVNGGVYMG